MAMVIGLTGSFGTGKTFVASIFRSLGARVVDADRIAHEVIRKGSPEHKRIVRFFGKGILNKKGEIGRRRLGAIVFSDPGLLKRLAGIVHPAVIAGIRRSVGSAGKEDVIVIDAPLLIEAKLGGLADKLVVVKCSRRSQVKRCQEKFRMRKSEILKRIASQMPLRKKTGMADFVIENSGTEADTIRQVKKLWEERLWR